VIFVAKTSRPLAIIGAALVTLVVSLLRGRPPSPVA